MLRGQKRIVFLGERWRLDRQGAAPFWGGVRLRYPPQKFSTILMLPNKIKIGQTVSLNTAEKKLAYFVARNRNARNRCLNVVNLKVSPRDGVTIDLEGVAGELAFCKMFNLYPDLDTDRMPPYPEFDARLSDGWTVDVKTTRYGDGKLLVDVRKGRKVDGVDFYCLMTGEFPGPYTFRGFMAKSLLVRPEKRGVVRGHEAYMAEQSELAEDPFLF